MTIHKSVLSSMINSVTKDKDTTQRFLTSKLPVSLISTQNSLFSFFNFTYCNIIVVN